MKIDPVALTKKLITFDTTARATEKKCAAFLIEILRKAKFNIECFELEPGRTNIIADFPGTAKDLPICFTGHMDIVPFGDAAWTKKPLGAEISGDKLYGRGSSDMKSGVAAMISAAVSATSSKPLKRGIKLAITAAEEESCRGTKFMCENKLFKGGAGAIVVCEPTSNYPYVGHKGSLWVKLSFKGVSAHGSMPEKGVSAIYKAAEAALRLRDLKFTAKNKILGSATINVGKIEGGVNYNLVPDHAALYVDIRSVPEITHKEILSAVRKITGKDASFDIVDDNCGFVSNPSDPWIKKVFGIYQEQGFVKPSLKGLTYFTDAVSLRKAFGDPPTIIMGPGEALQAHKTDEFCYVSKITEAAKIYRAVIADWCF
ncbi:MAG: hypothetical protein A2020_10770 [Lentisphaerae bacterium GWF2_45_14]|nr:MAG: hypothetical protein A2020_10770 [Lentisphaerae bacterium GWF2_45_14]